tara:strand:+ start:197 stop:367 length:171 start_codon:yes stop_codon:yes gene_type:complete
MKCYFCGTTGAEGGIALMSFSTGMASGSICTTCLRNAIYFYVRDHDKKRTDRAENE